MISHQDIFDNINMCNNGKMLFCRFTIEERVVVKQMLEEGILAKATFMNFGDAVRIQKGH